MTLFAAASVLVAVLAAVAVINTARLVLRLRRLELVPAAHKLWDHYRLWLWLPPLIFVGAVALGTHL